MIFLRLLFQTVVLAVGQLWANKVRALLTTLGVIIAVWAVVLTGSAMEGFRTFLLDQFAVFGANQVWVFPRMPPGQRDRYSWRQVRMNIEQVDKLLPNCPSLQYVSPVLQINAPVQHADRSLSSVQIQGVRPSWHQIEQRFVTFGRPLTENDEEEALPVCLVNDKAIEELGLSSDPSGTRVWIEGRRFMVVGVLETKQVSPIFGADSAQSELTIPYRTAQIMRPENSVYAVAATRNPNLHEDAREEIRAIMRKMRNLSADEPDTFGVEAIQAAITTVKRVTGAMTVLLTGVVGIALLVGGIGIMNIMLVSVSERTREIGLRKAVGARPEVILLQFLVEAVVLCLAGCAFGMLVASAIVYGVRATDHEFVRGLTVPAWSIMLAVGFSAATGVIFGMFPAIKAARLDPIVALRHE